MMKSKGELGVFFKAPMKQFILCVAARRQVERWRFSIIRGLNHSWELFQKKKKKSILSSGHFTWIEWYIFRVLTVAITDDKQVDNEIIYIQTAFLIFNFSPQTVSAWKFGVGSELLSADGEADGFWGRSAAELCSLHSPSPWQPGICCPWGGSRRTCVSDLWPLEPWGGHLCDPERGVTLPGWERGRDVPQHLPARLQLPWRLLPGREPGGAGLCVSAAKDGA